MQNKTGIAGLVTAALLSLALTGCTTTDAYTGEEKMSKTSQGAIIGALSGALAGAAAGKGGKGILIGATGGAAAGGAVGYYMDRQEEKLRQRLADTGVSVTREEDRILLNMPGNITFSTASSDIQDDFYKVLAGVSEILAEFEQTRIEVAGHTDDIGSETSNQQLSLQRALQVAGYLQQQGIEIQRIDTIGYGESRPVVANNDAQSRSMNRRVEITLIPDEQAIR